MRRAAFFTTIAPTSALAFAAQAAPLGPVSNVHVAIGPDLQAQAKDYGPRDLDYLAADLQDSEERALTRTGGLSAEGGTLDLGIEEATPNRPTMRQMSSKPGLSYESFGIGGARISGVLTTADGRQVPVAYHWYETDIRWSQVTSTWADAQTSFDRFARKLASDDAVDER